MITNCQDNFAKGHGVCNGPALPHIKGILVFIKRSANYQKSYLMNIVLKLIDLKNSHWTHNYILNYSLKLSVELNLNTKRDWLGKI